MKQILSFTFSIIIFIAASKTSSAQIPAYTLQAKNFVIISPNLLNFEIFIEHTDANQYEYASGQFFFYFNPAIANGETLNYFFAPAATGDSSDFPPNMRPRGPSIGGGNMLRLASNSLPGPGSGFILQQGVPKKIIKMKLSTSAASFANVPLNFQWVDSCTPGPLSVIRTKLNAYIAGTNTEITRCHGHSIDSSGILLKYNITVAIEGLYKSASNSHNRRDTVSLFLRNANLPYNIIDSAKAVIDSLTLTGNYTFHYTPNGKYYLVVKHFNTIETWSKSGGDTAVLGNTYNYDFTTSASQAYGNNMVLRGTRYCIYSGDVTQDLIIDLSDMAAVDNDVFNYAKGYRPADLNGDYFVEQSDYAIVDNNRLKEAKAPLYGN
jgi:hypothetical protein